MDFKVDWNALPVMDSEVKPRPLKAVALWKMDKGGLRKVTATDNFKEMDKFIRDYSSTGHNRMKVCVLTAHWDVEDAFKGYGVMAVPLRVDRRLSMEEGICEKALLQDALRQCKFIREETTAQKDQRHTNTLATSLYCLDGLREPFLSAMRDKWERSPEEFIDRYVKGLKAGQEKTVSPVTKAKEARAVKTVVKARPGRETGKKGRGVQKPLL